MKYLSKNDVLDLYNERELVIENRFKNGNNASFESQIRHLDKEMAHALWKVVPETGKVIACQPITKEQFLELQAVLEHMEMAWAKGEDKPEHEEVAQEIEKLMDDAPWQLIPGEGCVPRTPSFRPLGFQSQSDVKDAVITWLEQLANEKGRSAEVRPIDGHGVVIRLHNEGARPTVYTITPNESQFGFVRSVTVDTLINEKKDVHETLKHSFTQLADVCDVAKKLLAQPSDGTVMNTRKHYTQVGLLYRVSDESSLDR